MSTKKVWFITGASKGFGLEFIKQLLAKGDAVAATSRSLSQLKNAAATDDKNFLPLEMEITNEASVKEAIDSTVAAFGKIDILVNNAGYGLVGGVEELTDAEARRNFDVNVFGSLNVIRAAMPQLRKQGSGHILNFSSIAGVTGSFPAFGIYCATKFAVNGFTEALALEAKPFGIKTTLVLPGYFRTNFLESDSIVTPKKEMQEYTEVRAMQQAHEEQIRGNQPGDPVKGVAEVIKMTEAETAPLYFFLGSDAVNMAEQKLEFLKNEIESWREASTSTEFAIQN